MVTTTVGERVRELRKKLGWTQEDLCEYSGVSTCGIYRVENDRRHVKLDTIVKLAKALGVKYSDLADTETEDLMEYLDLSEEDTDTFTPEQEKLIKAIIHLIVELAKTNKN